jgi:hypothetical protein
MSDDYAGPMSQVFGCGGRCTGCRARQSALDRILAALDANPGAVEDLQKFMLVPVAPDFLCEAHPLCFCGHTAINQTPRPGRMAVLRAS